MSKTAPANGYAARLSYAVNDSGMKLNQSLRCASDSYRLEISGNVRRRERRRYLRQLDRSNSSCDRERDRPRLGLGIIARVDGAGVLGRPSTCGSTAISNQSRSDRRAAQTSPMSRSLCAKDKAPAQRIKLRQRTGREAWPHCMFAQIDLSMLQPERGITERGILRARWLWRRAVMRRASRRRNIARRPQNQQIAVSAAI